METNESSTLHSADLGCIEFYLNQIHNESQEGLCLLTAKQRKPDEGQGGCLEVSHLPPPEQLSGDGAAFAFRAFLFLEMK